MLKVKHVYGLLACLLALLLLPGACASASATAEPWSGACEAGTARITGEVEGRSVDLTVVENYGYQTHPALWAVFFDEGIRLTLTANTPGREALGSSQGVFVLGADEPLHCATDGTWILEEPPRGQLRTLTRLGSCPGTEQVAGTIEGCLDPNAGCIVSGGPLPEGGVEVGGSSFSQDATEYTFQIELRDGRVLDFDSVREGGTVFYKGEVFCAEDVSVAPVGETFEFSFGRLTKLGRCIDATAVSGFIDVCLPPIS